MERIEPSIPADAGGMPRNPAHRGLQISRYQRLDFSDLEAIWSDLLHAQEPTGDLSAARGRVFTMGSCFALNLANQLAAHGVPVAQLPVSEFFNTPLYNLQIVRACVGSASEMRESRDHINLARNQGSAKLEDTDFERAGAAIVKASCFVFTVGVGFLWREKETNKFVISPDLKQIAKYESHYPTAQEQMAYLREIVNLVRGVNSSVTIWFTVSPVPLELTTAYASAIVGDCVSKSILRDAVHLLMYERLPNVRYFPSFEFVRWCGGHVGRSMYGADGKVRHVDDDIVDMIVRKFLWLNGYRPKEPGQS